MTGDSGRSDTEDTEASRPSLREQIKQQAREYGVDVDDLLIQSRRRDPMFKGTNGDHAKAEWFADLWEQAVAGRDQQSIHVRGVHYYIVMSTDEGTTLNIDQLPVAYDPDELEQLEGPVRPPTNCSWDEYANTDKCYDYLEEAATLARILGYIPLDGIHDNKHSQLLVTKYGDHRAQADVSDLSTPTGVSLPSLPREGACAELEFDEPDEFADYLADQVIDEAIEQIEFDATSQAPFHVEIWCEKGLPDYIHALARELGVNVIVEGEGDLSLTIASEFVQRVEAAGKPAVVLYLSDFDVIGDGMASAMAGKVAWLDERGDLTQRVCIEQVAVTQDQVERFGLPRKPISESEYTGTGGKAYDTLVSEWEERKGAGACELNTLEQIPALYKQIVRDAVEPYRDPGLEDKNELALREWRAELRAVIREHVDEAGFPEHVDDLEAWIGAWNSRLEEIEPVVTDLRQRTRDGFYAEWRDAVETTLEHTEWPTVTVPEGEGMFPDDPLFDSDRAYPENVARVQRHKEGE
ncbi:hypothetical protein [Natronorubrum daqingense]|uniref:Uncharacterized protein n=1 Tax=Natronorubrum daqingense TaxID=588898 RepID=A0A1N7FX92_9EURY|nr:hypothetical protein [Natronorubrum daqingense]APX98669.1 hypothetical protein BB347_17635 [Natronorubrum daqingense]SIS04951.1 hypothetical protein SAMN05421809_3534 [Natronorubrum daqingense]